MKPRTRLGVATAVATALTLLGWTATGSGAGKPQEITAAVSFRNASDDMIQGAAGQAISATILSSTGALFLTDDDVTGHRVHVYFDAPTTPAPSPFNCMKWEPGALLSYEMAPAYDLSQPKAVQIGTLNQFEYTVRYGWVPVMNQATKNRAATAHILDLRKDVPPGAKRYVQVMIRLFVNSSNDLYEVWMNREWPTESGYGYGVFEIEAASTNASAPGSAGDKFTIRPLVPGQPYPLQGLDQNEALLRMIDYADAGQDTSGPCDMGNFLMPFEMTITRK